MMTGLAVFSSQAQTSFGIRGGANLFHLAGEDVSESDYTNRVGFHAGIYASFLQSGPVAIEPGIYYSVKGAQNDDAINSRAVLDYVDVPLLFRFKFGEGFNVFAGPQLSFLTKSKFEGDWGDSTYSLETDAIKDTDAGVVVGLGYTLPQGFNVQGSYDFGMTPILKDSDLDIYNRGFKLSLGYSF